jgi:ABC-type thiamine transport system substrate-binding protein
MKTLLAVMVLAMAACSNEDVGGRDLLTLYSVDGQAVTCDGPIRQEWTETEGSCSFEYVRHGDEACSFAVVRFERVDTGSDWTVGPVFYSDCD